MAYLIPTFKRGHPASNHYQHCTLMITLSVTPSYQTAVEEFDNLLTFHMNEKEHTIAWKISR